MESNNVLLLEGLTGILVARGSHRDSRSVILSSNCSNSFLLLIHLPPID
jgi:hypothetical protein